MAVCFEYSIFQFILYFTIHPVSKLVVKKSDINQKCFVNIANIFVKANKTALGIIKFPSFNRVYGGIKVQWISSNQRLFWTFKISEMSW